MTTMQGTEQDTGVTGSTGYHMGQPIALHPYLWKGLAEKFLKGEPKVLGVVQIVIALMNFSFGVITMSVTITYHGQYPFSVYTCYTIWGSVMFIVSGSLSIGAGKRTTKGMVRGSLGVNITSSIFAAIGIIFMAISLHIYSFHPYICYGTKMQEDCAMVVSIITGLEFLVLILSILEFCIAVSLSAFGCRVTCCNPGGVVLIMPSNSHMAESSPSAPFMDYSTPAIVRQKNIP